MASVKMWWLFVLLLVTKIINGLGGGEQCLYEGYGVLRNFKGMYGLVWV